MRRRIRPRAAIVAAMLAVVLMGHVETDVTAQALLPPEGEWAEVLTATPKWLVLQNRRGQQLPVALTTRAIELFVIRWPTSPERISARAVIEVAGLDVGANNVIRADHLDVFEPDAQGFLNNYWPVITRVSATGLVQTPYTIDPLQAADPYAYINRLASISNLPDRMHAVAPIAEINPIRLAVGNNNTLTVLPSGYGLSMTRITAGSPNAIRPGDLVYYVPTSVGTKSLVLSQLVVYKRVPFEQFRP